METDVLLLNEKIENLFNEAWQIISDYETWIDHGGHNTQAQYFDEKISQFDERVTWVNTELFNHIAVLSEKLNLGDHAKEIKRDFRNIKAGKEENMRLDDVKRHDQAGVFYSPVLQHINTLYAPISSLVRSRAPSQMDVVERILKRTPWIVRQAHGDTGASKEKDVENCIFEILEHAFSDTKSQVPIPQKTKTYKMDLAISSLKTGIEVKFAKNKAGFNKAVGEIYTDIKGYSNDPKWQRFYALIYLKNHVSDATNLFNEFRDVNAPVQWTPIIVTELKPDDNI